MLKGSREREKIEKALEKIWYNDDIISDILIDTLKNKDLFMIIDPSVSHPLIKSAPLLIRKYNENNESKLTFVNSFRGLLEPLGKHEKGNRLTQLERIFKLIQIQEGSNTPKEITIISTYNKGNNHWLSHVSKIKKAKDNSYKCSTYLHDPFGGGQFKKKDEQTIVEDLVKAFLGEQTSVKFEFPISPYAKRQQDGVSCGVITTEEIIQLATTGEIEQKACPEGALALRKKHLLLLNAQYDVKPGGFEAIVTKIEAKDILSYQEYKIVVKKVREKVENAALNKEQEDQEDETKMIGSSYKEGELEALQGIQASSSQLFNIALQEESAEIKREKLRTYAKQLDLEERQKNIAVPKTKREKASEGSRGENSSTTQEISGNNNHSTNLKGAFMPCLAAGILLVITGATSAYINKQKGNNILALCLIGITAIIALLTSIICAVLLLIKPVGTDLESPKLESIALPKENGTT